MFLRFSFKSNLLLERRCLLGLVDFEQFYAVGLIEQGRAHVAVPVAFRIRDSRDYIVRKAFFYQGLYKYLLRNLFLNL